MVCADSDFNFDTRRRFPDYGKYLFVFIALFLLLLTIYGNSFHGEWHFDDEGNIVSNVNIHLKSLSWPDIKNTFYFRGDLGRPLSYLSFALNYYLGGLDIFGYHLVNFVIHYISSAFLFLFIYNALKLPILQKRYDNCAYSISLMSTFLWAVNPVQVLAVSYIVQRMASMAGMFYIMSMYFYLKGRMSGKVPFFVLCFASALLAFGTKENTAMLPVTLFFFDLFLIQGVNKETIIKNIKIGIIPLFILFGLGMYYMGFSSFMSGYDDRPFTIAERLLTEPRVILLYISLLLYPIDLRLMLLHDIQISHTIFAPWTTLPAILLILLIVCCVLYFSNKKPLVSFCVLFFFLNHLIEGSVLPLELIYEHRNYVPSMLFFVPVAILIVKLVNYLSYRRSIQIVVVFGVALLFVIQGHAVYMRNDTLRSDLVMWKDNVKKAPNLSRPHNNLGDEYFNMGLRLEAFCEFKKALDLNRYSRLQNKAIAEYNIGRFYWLGDMDDKALVHFKKAISISPTYPSPLHGMAMIEMKSGNVEAARDRCMEILKYNPQHIESRELLSLALLKLGELEQSIDESQRALNLNPGKTFSLVVMAEAFRKKGENGKAIMYWKKFMKVNPRNIDVHLALIELYSLTGKNDALTETIDSLMCVKAGRNLEEIICERKDGKILAYLPDRKKILGIIRENLSDRIKSVKS